MNKTNIPEEIKNDPEALTGYLFLAELHLPGKHDQKKHGNDDGEGDEEKMVSVIEKASSKHREWRRMLKVKRIEEFDETTKEKYSVLAQETFNNFTWVKNFDNRTTELHEFCENSFVFTDNETGFSTEVVNVDFPRDSGGRIINRENLEVSGLITNKNGKIIGSFSRIISSDGTVTNEVFSLSPDYRKKGFGAKFYANQEKYFVRFGVKKVYLYANITNGGYTWSRMGYDVIGGDIDNIIEEISRMTSQPGKFDRIINTKRDWTTWELASLPISDIKSIMADISFDAYKNLSNPYDEGFIAGILYYESKGIK